MNHTTTTKTFQRLLKKDISKQQVLYNNDLIFFFFLQIETGNLLSVIRTKQAFKGIHEYITFVMT